MKYSALKRIRCRLSQKLKDLLFPHRPPIHQFYVTNFAYERFFHFSWNLSLGSKWRLQGDEVKNYGDKRYEVIFALPMVEFPLSRNFTCLNEI